MILDPLGGRTELTWDHGLLTRVTDPAGVAVEFDYDDYGTWWPPATRSATPRGSSGTQRAAR